VTLRDLEAFFIKILPDDEEGRQCYTFVENIVDADGVEFLCPVCFVTNHGRVGTHMVICWQPNVPQTRSPKPGRWNLVGSSLDDLSLVAGSSSVKLEGGCNAHFFVEHGQIRLC
jgi:hypothetical protein